MPSLFDEVDSEPTPAANPTPSTPPATGVRKYVTNPNWKKLLKEKDGKPVSSLNNAKVYLEHHPDFAGTIFWNTYAKRVEIRGGVLDDDDKKKEFESVVVDAMDYLSKNHDIDVAHDGLAKRIIRVARKYQINPLTEWLDSLRGKWDGTKRAENIFIHYFGAGRVAGEFPTEDEQRLIAHLRRVGRCWLLGALERAYRPGSKVDNVIVLEGRQGQKKTSAMRVLGGDYYCSTQITLGDKDSKMIAACNWFVDLPDTKFMNKTNKGFVTMQEDTFRPPYGSSIAKAPRCCIFIGSINPDGDGYFDDSTGNRRYWPIKCDNVRIADLMRDREQIWAEVVEMMYASETCEACLASDDTVPDQRPRCAEHRWWLSPEEELEAEKEVDARGAEVPLMTRIHAWWLDLEPSKRPASFTTDDVARDALKMDDDVIARDAKSLHVVIGMAVRSIKVDGRLGFIKTRVSISGTQHWVYKPTQEMATKPQVKRARREGASAFVLMDGGKI